VKKLEILNDESLWDSIGLYEYLKTLKEDAIVWLNEEELGFLLKSKNLVIVQYEGRGGCYCESYNWEEFCEEKRKEAVEQVREIDGDESMEV